ncbi:MAG: Membrane dipeptidase [Phycisphaerales bacterium]|nr:Membrane dipeptidase [Phycisphaerales bacterium]
MTRPIFDAHLDLAWSAVCFNRDLTLSVEEIRKREQGMTDEPARGGNTLSLPELHNAGVRVCVATLLARGGPEQKWQAGYKRSDLDWANQTHAYAAAHAQLAYYRMMEKQGHVRVLRTARELEAHWHGVGNDAGTRGRGDAGKEEGDCTLQSANCKVQTEETNAAAASAFTAPQSQISNLKSFPSLPLSASPRPLVPASSPSSHPLGIILSMEGADPIVTPDQVQEWWNLGLRAVGPAHYGRGHYAYGTAVSGPLSDRGVELLREFERVGMILDATHLCDESMAQALDNFGGKVLASHHNCRALVPGDRQLADEQIKRLIQRNAVIGVALDAWMLYPNWVRGQTKPEVVGLSAVADHIDHVCQIAGSTRHSAIGSDLDGGFGIEQTPRDLNTIADLQKLGGILGSRGYSEADIDLIFHGNWLGFFRDALPAY